MSKILFSAALAAAALAGTAGFAGSLAAPVIEPAPVVAPAPIAAADWSGFYLGGIAGFQSGAFDPDGLNYDVNATTYGGFAGYNMQSGSFVYGAEVAGQLGGYSIENSGTTLLDDNIDYMIDARLRLGYAFDNVLVYGAGGYTFGQAADGASTYDFNGFNLGAGVELAVTDNIFVGAEYIYRNLSADVGGSTYDVNTHGIQAKIGYRF